MMGLPCVTVAPEALEEVMALAELRPTTEFELDLTTSRLTAGALSVPIELPEATRSALISGNWDATGLLVDRYDEVERVAANLPYVSGWTS
jgi:3-isopropylmalate/(R)-2-methylmalate dehydratase small subunit